jgi:hypothetical protein
MQYIKFWGNTGYCGTDYEEFVKYEEDRSEQYLNDRAYELGRENAEGFEYLVFGWDGPDMEEYTQDEVDDEIQMFYENIDYGYTVLTEKEWYEEQGLDLPIGSNLKRFRVAAKAVIKRHEVVEVTIFARNAAEAHEIAAEAFQNELDERYKGDWECDNGIKTEILEGQI